MDGPGRPGARRPRAGHRSAVVLVVAALVAVLVAGCSGGDGGTAATTTDGGSLEVSTVSTRPEYVTGGDVLIRVTGAEGDAEPRLTVDGQERAGVLIRMADDGWTGLVEGLPEGRSTLEVRAGARSGTLEVRNHPVTGPLFSGPHLEPFVCTAEANGLGPALDEDCSAPTVVRWSYVDTSGAVKPLTDPAHVPADVRMVRQGSKELPLVVRTESGTINRAVYWISVLDPTPSSGWEGASDGWNGDLVYRFGGGCGTTYSQGEAMVSGSGDEEPTVDPELLARGFAVATSTLNTFQVACNDVVSAETVLMVQERFAEHFGLPEHVIGEGGSGGAIQQLLIAQNYPGLLDALTLAAPFPDAVSMAPGVSDCGLLGAFYAGPQGATFTEEQRLAVNGHAATGTCATWVASFLQTLDPTEGCALPAEEVYDPVARPDGVRCTLQDANLNLFGVDDATGFAARPLDNVGVQYGLEALRSGIIGVEQFLTLNESIGGYDLDGNVTPERERASESDLRHLYETGRVNLGAGDLRTIPIVAVNTYSDPTGDIHDRWRVFSIRDRLSDDDGAAPNLVVWTAPGGDLGSSLSGGRADLRNEAIDVVAAWLDRLGEREGAADAVPPGVAERTEGHERDAEELLAARPAEAVDRCITPDGTPMTGPELYEEDNACTRAYPLAGDPRQVAGEDRAATTAKCRLAPIDLDDYGVELTAEQEARLRAVFRDGVCDWSRPGVGEVQPRSAWQDFSR